MSGRKTKMARFQRIKTIFLSLFVSLVLVMSGFFVLESISAAAPTLIFPVIGNSSYSNDFNAPRSSGNHNAIDILAKKRQQLVSVVDGTITNVQYPQPSWGYSVTVRSNSGYRFTYIHMNDDNPGTNDGRGGGMNAYAPDVKVGNKVAKGQFIGRVGDSGFSNGVSHLHFEMRDPSNKVVNPYVHLNRAKRISKPVVAYPQQDGEFLPHGNTFRGGAKIALGNFDGDIENEVAVASGPGGYYVKLYEQDGSYISRFAPNGTSFKGGIDITTGDFDNDGVDEIVTASGKGGSYVKVFNVGGTSSISRFAPYGVSYTNGMQVDVGDFNNDGVKEIVTGTGKGATPRVSIFELDGTNIGSFLAYSSSFKGGVSVASGNVTGDAADEIITGAGPTGGPRVSIFSPDGTRLNTYYAYHSTFKGGISVNSAELDSDHAMEEIITVPSTLGSPRAKIFNASGGVVGYTDYFAEIWWKGTYDIGAVENELFSSIGVNRRSSVRETQLP